MLPIGLAVFAGTLSAGYLMGGSDLVLNNWPLIADYARLTRPSPSRTASDTGAPPVPSSFAHDASGAGPAAAMPREYASGPPPDRPRERPVLPSGQAPLAQVQPAVPSLPAPAPIPLAGRREASGASTAGAELRFVGAPTSLGANRLTSQELREAGDEAYRRGDFSAAIELYDRSQQMFDMEHPARAEALDVAVAPRAERLEPAVAEPVPEAVPTPPPVAVAVAPQPDKLAAAPVPPAEPSRLKPDAGPSPSAPVQAAQGPSGAYAALMRNGDAAFERGDISGARALYQRAASLDTTAAAAHTATGKTYDPGILIGLGVRGGALPDAAAAARWYERAQSLGDPAAKELLSRLR